jgi:hypothetical protein
MAQNNQLSGILCHDRHTECDDVATKTVTLIFLEGFGRYSGFTCEREPRLEHNTYHENNQ